MHSDCCCAASERALEPRASPPPPVLATASTNRACRVRAHLPAQPLVGGGVVLEKSVRQARRLGCRQIQGRLHDWVRSTHEEIVSRGASSSTHTAAQGTCFPALLGPKTKVAPLLGRAYRLRQQCMTAPRASSSARRRLHPARRGKGPPAPRPRPRGRPPPAAPRARARTAAPAHPQARAPGRCRQAARRTRPGARAAR